MSVAESVASLKRLRRLFSMHPLTRDHQLSAYARFAWLQIVTRIVDPPLQFEWVGGTRLFVKHGMRGVTGEYYTGCLEYEDTIFCAHFLRPGDLFLDVGCNVGTYSVLAACHSGARVVAVEPIEGTVEQLGENLRLNGIDQMVKVIRKGISSSSGSLRFTSQLDALNRVTQEDKSDTVLVDVTSIDQLMLNEAPILIKIDVEGHEWEVLKGAKRVLSTSQTQAVLVEISDKDKRFLDYFMQLGFQSAEYVPDKRSLVLTNRLAPHNTLFVKDVELVRARLETAVPILVRSELI